MSTAPAREPPDYAKPQSPRARALAHVNRALDLCDQIGATTAACHLQLGADFLGAEDREERP